MENDGSKKKERKNTEKGRTQLRRKKTVRTLIILIYIYGLSTRVPVGLFCCVSPGEGVEIN